MNAGRVKSKERGVAAIEFALVFVLLFSVLYAVATFGAVFYMQQTVTRAAEEGARAAGQVTAPTSNDPRVRAAVFDALANSLVVPASFNASPASRRGWIESRVVVTAAQTGAGASASYVVTVSYPYSQNRLLPTMPLLDLSTWVPDQLRSRASIALRS